MKQDTIAVVCPGCGSVVWIALNEPLVIDREAKKELAQMVVEGYSVQHMTLEEFRTKTFGCKCPDEQPELQITPDNLRTTK